MSIDITRFERYDYNLVFRPDGLTHNTNVLSSKTLHSQALNIPSRVATSHYKKGKFYLYLRSAKLGQIDASNVLAIQQLKNFYLLVEGITSQTFSNSNWHKDMGVILPASMRDGLTFDQPSGDVGSGVASQDLSGTLRGLLDNPITSVSISARHGDYFSQCKYVQ